MVTKTKPKESTTGSQVVDIAIEDLLPNPYQPTTRIYVDSETAKKFALSFQQHGMILYPVARPAKEQPGKYECGDGWLRRSGYEFNYKEFGLAQYSKIPCVIKDLTDQQMADMVMEANTVRKDLNPIELAKLYKKYLEDFKIPQAELAKKHNCSQGEIANTIRLLELPEALQQKIISQEISETHGRQLLRLNNKPELQNGLAQVVIKDGISVNELSNKIASELYYSSENLDPDGYPNPEFDTTGCQNCPQRQKIGCPYQNDKKSWRCLDKDCYKKKIDQAEKERADKLAAEIAAAKKEAGEDKPGSKRKKDAGILDLSNLTWRDYQSLDNSAHKIDTSECKNCPRRALGKNWRDKTEMVCIDVKCFKLKEAAADKQRVAEVKEAERLLTDRMVMAAAGITNPDQAYKTITGYLLNHCRKDTREKFARIYEVKEYELTEAFGFGEATGIDILNMMVCLVLQIERYEGDKGAFQKMLADLEGNSDELNKALDTHRDKHCKGCAYDNDNRDCKHLLSRHGNGWNDKCYHFSKAKDDDKENGDIDDCDEEDCGDEYDCGICFNMIEVKPGGRAPKGWTERKFEKGSIWVCPDCEDEPTCRVCGCSQNNACKGPCYWVEEDLCSACEDVETTDDGPQLCEGCRYHSEQGECTRILSPTYTDGKCDLRKDVNAPMSDAEFAARANARPWPPQDARSTAIPEGVRLAEDVTSNECAGCNLTAEDHTVNFSFPVPYADGDRVAYQKVCLKDYRAHLKKKG